jgi:hypothetical protein
MMNFNIDRFFVPPSIVLTALTGLTGFSVPVLATTTSMTNPCPRIYYEEPYNSSRISPVACPPNAATRLRNEQSQPVNKLPSQLPILVPGTTASPSQQPLSPVEPAPIGMVQLQSGRVNVTLKNMTNTQITYQAIGHTPPRNLVSKTDIVLQDISSPMTITFLRPDAGLIRVTMVANSGSGELVLMLDEATGLSDSQTSVRIQSNGNVLAY